MRSRAVIDSKTSHGKRSKKAHARRRSMPWLWLVVPLVLWLGYREVKGFLRQPQAILMLGGSSSALERESFTAEFALQHPDLPIWISSGDPNQDYVLSLFDEAGVDRDRLYLDYQAVDTVTNFTTLVNELKAQGITSVYLITSDYHMRRARVIGEIVFGSRGIDFKPIAVPTDRPPEPLEKVVRDGARAMLWVATGRTGSSLSHLLDTTQHSP